MQVELTTGGVGTLRRDGRDYVVKHNRCLGDYREGSGGLVNAAWGQWDATLLRRGGEEVDGQYVLKTNVTKNDGNPSYLFNVKYK